MSVHKPGRVLLKSVPLRFVRNKVAGGGRKAADAQIILVPFIDFLIVLVVFLLTSFSATGELLAQQPNLRMPDAHNTIALEIAPIIAINPQIVTLDGRRMADTATLASTPQAERIEALVQDLDTLKRNWGMLHPGQPFPATVIIQADQGIDFVVIKKIMYSAAQAGYVNMSFAVNKRGD